GVLKISDSLSFEEAAMIEPLACCVRAWTKFSYHENDSAAIFGVGPTGMMHVMLAHAKKFSKIFCLDVNDFRLNFAKKFNITDSINSQDESRKQKILDHTDGRGVDVAIVATSSLKALDDAIDVVRKGGVVMMFGVPSKGALLELDMNKIYSKEITLVTSYAASDQDTKSALELIENSQIDVKQLITHTYSIEDSQKAFDHARTGKNAMKIIIRK
ncbi:MAG: zinc-binding dehydrogenase, partial [Nitrosopumilus sp.]|nr:zinc-binding dehydrogenase [Nitrosopumilus sp.]